MYDVRTRVLIIIDAPSIWSYGTTSKTLISTKFKASRLASSLNSVTQPSGSFLQTLHDSLKRLELHRAAAIHTPNLVLTKPAGLLVHIFLLNAIQGLEHVRLHATEARSCFMYGARPRALIIIDAPSIGTYHTTVQRSLRGVCENLFNRWIVRPFVQHATSSTVLHTSPPRTRGPCDVTALFRSVRYIPTTGGGFRRFLCDHGDSTTRLCRQKTTLRFLNVTRNAVQERSLLRQASR